MTLVALTTFLMQIGKQLSFPSVMEEVRLVCLTLFPVSSQRVLPPRMQYKHPSLASVSSHTVQFAQQNKCSANSHKTMENHGPFGPSLHPGVHDNKRYKEVLSFNCPTERSKCTKAQTIFLFRKPSGILTIRNITHYVRINRRHYVKEATKDKELGHTTELSYTTVLNYRRELNSRIQVQDHTEFPNEQDSLSCAVELDNKLHTSRVPLCARCSKKLLAYPPNETQDRLCYKATGLFGPSQSGNAFTCRLRLHAVNITLLYLFEFSLLYVLKFGCFLTSIQGRFHTRQNPLLLFLSLLSLSSLLLLSVIATKCLSSLSIL